MNQYRGNLKSNISPITASNFFASLPEQLKGNQLQSRYLVGSKIGIGAFGIVF